MRQRLANWLQSLKLALLAFMFKAPWYLPITVFRLLYGFRVEGEENIPDEGPFMLVIREPTLVGVFVSGWISIIIRLRVLGHRHSLWMSYMQENLLALPYFRKLAESRELGGYGALLDHGAGRMALSLVDGYRTLRDGGLVSLNPYGEGAWDGRTKTIGRSAAWLGLHTAAPLLPAICSIGAYDIWPRWRMWPSGRGRLVLRIGKPFTLCNSPQQKVTDEDVARASEQVQAMLDPLCYGPGGIPEWMGPPTRGGVPIDGPVQVRQIPQATIEGGNVPARGAVQRTTKGVPAWKRGITQLLWRCPVCCTHDALVQQRRWFSPPGLHCTACQTRWQILRVVSKDFRLRVLEGPPDLIGLEMSLSAWYDEMKRDFRPVPIAVDGVELLADEEAYLAAEGVSLAPYLPNPLFEGWTDREAPDAQPRGRPGLPAWDSLGEARCILTNHRLLWQGADRELDFMWSSVTAVHLWLVSTLGIEYGRARYRFGLGQEVGLKWLTHVGFLAQQAAARDGHRLTVSSY